MNVTYNLAPAAWQALDDHLTERRYIASGDGLCAMVGLDEHGHPLVAVRQSRYSKEHAVLHVPSRSLPPERDRPPVSPWCYAISQHTLTCMVYYCDPAIFEDSGLKAYVGRDHRDVPFLMLSLKDTGKFLFVPQDEALVRKHPPEGVSAPPRWSFNEGRHRARIEREHKEFDDLIGSLEQPQSASS